MIILHKDNNGVIKEYTCGDSKYNLNYSTSETDTGMTWIDGKKIYRKVYTGTTPNSSDKTNLQDISGLNISTCVKIEGYILSTYGWYPINSTIDGNTSAVWLSSQSNNSEVIISIRGHFSTPTQNKPYKIILEYTKTTI